MKKYLLFICLIGISKAFDTNTRKLDEFGVRIKGGEKKNNVKMNLEDLHKRDQQEHSKKIDPTSLNEIHWNKIKQDDEVHWNKLGKENKIHWNKINKNNEIHWNKLGEENQNDWNKINEKNRIYQDRLDKQHQDDWNKLDKENQNDWNKINEKNSIYQDRLDKQQQNHQNTLSLYEKDMKAQEQKALLARSTLKELEEQHNKNQQGVLQMNIGIHNNQKDTDSAKKLIYCNDDVVNQMMQDVEDLKEDNFNNNNIPLDDNQDLAIKQSNKKQKTYNNTPKLAKEKNNNNHTSPKKNRGKTYMIGGFFFWQYLRQYFSQDKS